MITLGIESTAHTFGAAVVKKDKKYEVLSNAMDSFSSETGGMIPHQVFQHHLECCGSVVQKALGDAGVFIKDVELIAFSQGPGLGQSLKVGATCARSLSLINNIPLIGVNHCIAHLEVGRLLTDAKDPALLYASGANTQIIAYDAGKYRVFGETLDMGVGNFIDQTARLFGLGFPGGPKFEKLALDGKKFFMLPYVVKGMDVSFGGLFTKVRNLLQNLEKHELTKADLAFSVQETIFAMLIEISERAMAHVGKKELLLGGGVACNKRLQEMAHKMCEARGAKCYVLPNQFNVDNAAMIGLTGMEMHMKGTKPISIKQSVIQPYERTDDVEVTWR